MQTDIPLKRLTALRAADLLPLIGAPNATLIAVESLELPASARRLDSVLRLRSPNGQEYLHVIEWQGYHDPGVLWRLAGYLAWLGQREPDVAVVGTVVYLVLAADVGGEISPPRDGVPSLGWRLPVVRLWELEAEAALAAGTLGLVVLSPLMRGASAALVQRAVDTVLAQASLIQQADLLSILGVFAEPLLARETFVRMVGKEKLMASDLLSYLMEEKLAEIEQQRASERAEIEQQRASERAEIEQQRASERAEIEQQRIAELAKALQEAAEDVIVVRFPNTPVGLVHNLQTITDPAQLKALRTAALTAPDQATVEQLLAALKP
jgi:hypothetical protein